MKWSSFALAVGRRSCVTMSVAAMLGAAATAFAQTAPAQAPAPAPAQAPAAGGEAASGQAAAPAQPPDMFKFSTDAGGIIWYVKPDKTADFESVWAAIRAKLAASDNPDYKALGDSLKIYKVATEVPAANGAPQDVLYLFVADPASKTLSYSPSPFLLFQSKLFTDQEGRDLYTKLNGSIDRISPMSLNKVQ